MSALRDRSPQLLGRLTLYSTESGGKAAPIVLGYSCVAFASKDKSNGGWDVRPLVPDEGMRPGETLTVGLLFLSGETAAKIMRQAGKFYLWERRFIGEVEVLPPA